MANVATQIGARIKELRETEMLTQQGFSERLGVQSSYISLLENGKNKPSEQLILSICREFRVSIDWLKEGKEKKYLPPVAYEKGHPLIEEIYRRLTSPDKPVPLSVVAKVLGIDPKNVPHDINLHGDFSGALWVVIKIFEEGGKKKINAIMSQLDALRPPIDQSDDLGKALVKALKEGAQ